MILRLIAALGCLFFLLVLYCEVVAAIWLMCGLGIISRCQPFA